MSCFNCLYGIIYQTEVNYFGTVKIKLLFYSFNVSFKTFLKTFKLRPVCVEAYAKKADFESVFVFYGRKVINFRDSCNHLLLISRSLLRKEGELIRNKDFEFPLCDAEKGLAVSPNYQRRG
jgi:hypothetical protein